MWTDCFDAFHDSQYLKFVYGDHAPTRMNWNDAEVIYPRFLTSHTNSNESIRTCFQKYKLQVYVRPFFEAM